MSKVMILNDKKLILASSSRYRRELLSRLRLPFESVSPQVDEAPVSQESPADTARRLARQKAEAVAQGHWEALIIGSDQVATLGGGALGKPGSHARAVEQLQAMSGREVEFHTAICLLDAATGQRQERTVPYSVRFRRLSPAVIERYLTLEQPYDCAGSAKVEALGISLLEWMRGDDPTALIGLPLIALTSMLANAGVAVP